MDGKRRLSSLLFCSLFLLSSARSFSEEAQTLADLWPLLKVNYGMLSTEVTLLKGSYQQALQTASDLKISNANLYLSLNEQRTISVFLNQRLEASLVELAGLRTSLQTVQGSLNEATASLRQERRKGFKIGLIIGGIGGFIIGGLAVGLIAGQ